MGTDTQAVKFESLLLSPSKMQVIEYDGHRYMISRFGVREKNGDVHPVLRAHGKTKRVLTVVAEEIDVAE